MWLRFKCQINVNTIIIAVKIIQKIYTYAFAHYDVCNEFFWNVFSETFNLEKLSLKNKVVHYTTL